jgi:hypothetical protein
VNESVAVQHHLQATSRRFDGTPRDFDGDGSEIDLDAIMKEIYG